MTDLCRARRLIKDWAKFEHDKLDPQRVNHKAPLIRVRNLKLTFLTTKILKPNK